MSTTVLQFLKKFVWINGKTLPIVEATAFLRLQMGPSTPYVAHAVSSLRGNILARCHMADPKRIDLQRLVPPSTWQRSAAMSFATFGFVGMIICGIAAVLIGRWATRPDPKEPARDGG